VAVGKRGAVLLSTNGKQWNNAPWFIPLKDESGAEDAPPDFSGVTSGNGLFVAAAEASASEVVDRTGRKGDREEGSDLTI